MSEIGSISNLAGANPAPVRTAPGARSTPPEPAAVQSAVARPITTPQAAVTQSPTAGNAEWKRNGDPGGPQKNLQTGDRQQLTGTVDQLNQKLRDYNTNLQFEIDDKYQEMVVRIVDRETKEVVRQIPSEEALALAKFFEDMEAEQGQEPPGKSSAHGKEGGRLKVEGWLLRATA